jgi:hypothetical protein
MPVRYSVDPATCAATAALGSPTAVAENVDEPTCETFIDAEPPRSIVTPDGFRYTGGVALRNAGCRVVKTR